ncbi:mannosyltransferase family protein [Streptomyces sp. H51]|uniref:mannosyltransferase family protein n=1 Tax=Streptomyces sp. H51 TaxID=3111770 RepID=UPI002D76AE97|nr:mannosyltransferase family protein [Streptomyces sp. H51]
MTDQLIEHEFTPAHGRVGRWRFHLSPSDRVVLQAYLLFHTTVWVIVYSAGWLFAAGGKPTHPLPMLSRWTQWDTALFTAIARDGYFPNGAVAKDAREAFLPGFPLLLRCVHSIIPEWSVDGLLVSFVAGGVAALALSRVAQATLPGQEVGARSVFFLLASPCAVFLAAGYSESLFLALALPAWLAAKKDNWRLAATLACAAGTVRVSGLFLATAMMVQFAMSAKARSQARHLPWLALPFLPMPAYTCYLYAHTGDWMAWKHAQERGWFRGFHYPWQTWFNTWEAAFSHTQPAPYAFMFQMEIAAVAAGILLLVVLLRQRRWPEVTYVGLSLSALSTSYWYMSVPRAALLWWPLWASLAAWSLRRPWAKSAYVSVAVPLMTLITVAFTSGRWAG